MDKKDKMYFVLGMIRAYVESGKEYKTVSLGEFMGKDFQDYVIGVSGTKNDQITLFDESINDERRHRVFEIANDFEVHQMVHLMLEALAYDMKNKNK